MATYLRIEGFRRLDMREAVELRPLTVMIGANGSGKTSLIEACSLISASAQGELRSSVTALGGLQSVLTRGEKTSARFSISMPLGPDDAAPQFAHGFELHSQGAGYYLDQEFTGDVVQERPDGIFELGPRSIHRSASGELTGKAAPPGKENVADSTETALSQLRVLPSPLDVFRGKLASSAAFAGASFDVTRRAPVRLPQQLRPAALPSAAGDDLISCLHNLREQHPDRFEQMSDALHVAFPGFERLQFPSVAAGLVAMTWKDQAFPQPFYANELSEGTLRFLWLCAILYSPELPTFTLIDEPELSLHPEMLRLLAEMLRDASMRSHLIVATHSEALVRFLKPAEILACDIEDGRTAMRWGDTTDVEQWLADYTLDQTWSMGRIGGRAS